jgi:phosphohistidine phosphatase SixA
MRTARRAIRLSSRLGFFGILLAAGLGATGLGATALGATALQAQIQQNSTVVYLVRHAEKLDDSSDPPLTAAGRVRAELLSELLRDAGLTHIHTTDLERTRDTAAPIAKRLGIEPRIYDASDLEGLAERLRATPGRHLVSGHSNTTPLLVRLLGGESTDISDPEYDRLYIVTLNPDGTAGTILIRYGSP